MARHLPQDYPSAIKIILGSLSPPLARTEGNGIEPFHYLPHIIFVAERGLDHHDLSMAAQRELTRRFSCEFSIRAYLERDTERTLPVLARWTKDTDEHVRRLVSEGTRPRLPWAPRLKRFQADPFPVLALLEELKDDPSEYVRRSVANSLDDISKDHPATVTRTCSRWLAGASPQRRALVQHALRTLIRSGHPDTIRLAGGDGGSSLVASGGVLPPRAHWRANTGCRRAAQQRADACDGRPFAARPFCQSLRRRLAKVIQAPHRHHSGRRLGHALQDHLTPAAHHAYALPGRAYSGPRCERRGQTACAVHAGWRKTSRQGINNPCPLSIFRYRSHSAGPRPPKRHPRIGAWFTTF